MSWKQQKINVHFLNKITNGSTKKWNYKWVKKMQCSSVRWQLFGTYMTYLSKNKMVEIKILSYLNLFFKVLEYKTAKTKTLKRQSDDMWYELYLIIFKK